ncbi:hypothetical protein J3E72DRAFT_378288 [Bipolaris maydis]|nr:hypothetical protein J3E72DRAFT_378288 [Bipolaris maydis]
MGHLNISTEPAPGVTIDQKDNKITITITAAPLSDDGVIGRDTHALWHAAYVRLREEHTKELVDFEEQAAIVFRPLQRRNSSNVLARSSMPGWHTMEPKAVLGAIRHWIFEGEFDGNKGTEGDEEKKEDQVCRALSSSKTILNRNVQENPGAHLAWVAAGLCIQTLVEKPLPASEAPGLAYIIARVAFYDRLAQLASKVPGKDEAGDKPLCEGLVDLYTAVLKQLIVVLALGYVPRETRAQQQKFDSPYAGVGSAAVHPIIALESSLWQHVGDKALEESITKLVRLQAPSTALSDKDGREAYETSNDTTKGDNHVDDDDGNGSDDEADDDDYSDADQSDNNENNDSNVDAKTYATLYDNRDDASVCREIQKLLCVAPIQPPCLPRPPLPPLHDSPDVLDGLYRWALKQDEYRRWCKLKHDDAAARAAQAEAENQPADGCWAIKTCRGTRVLELVPGPQPKLKKHLVEVVQVMGWPSLLDGDGENSKARYAALGTSCDFYTMLVLLCRIVRDEEFAPTCSIVDYMNVSLGDEDVDYEGGRDGSHKNGLSGSARTAQKRAWTVRDLVALVRTTCRQSRKVAWIMSSSSLFSSLSKGEYHLDLSPEDLTLGKVIYGHVRATLQDRLDKKRYTSDILNNLATELIRKASSHVTWSTIAVDLLARVRLPWNAMHVLQRLPDSSAGLGPLLDSIVRVNASDSDRDNSSAETLVETVLKVAALTFRPPTVLELAALAEPPATVDAVIFIDVLTRPLLELQALDNTNGRTEGQKYVYFSSRAVLAAQRARLAKDTTARDLHADMVCRHLHCLARHYGDAENKELSLYMEFAWLRHLDLVDIGPTENPPLADPLTNQVCGFVARNAGAWLCNLDQLGFIDVVRRRLSPIQAELKTLFMRIVRSQVLGMSLTDTEHFLRKMSYKFSKDKDDNLPIVPQLVLLGLPSLDSGDMAEAAALIATLEGHKDWVRNACWAYEGRLIVSISDDKTLRCWGRASCCMQHVTDDILHTGYANHLALSRTDPSMVVSMDNQDLVLFDLAIGAIPIAKRSHYHI